MAETAVDVREPPSEWSQMTPDEQVASVEEAMSVVRGETQEPEPAEPETKTPAEGEETPAGGDAGKGEKPEAEEAEPETTDWLDQETREYAAALGLSEELLSEFDSRDELDRHVRLFYQKPFEEAKAKAAQQASPAPVQQEAPKPPPVEQEGDPFGDLSAFKVKEEFFDPDAVAPIHKFMETTAADRKALQARLKELQDRVATFEQRERQQIVANIQQHAVTSAQALNPERYGKPGEAITKEQSENLAKVLEAHWIQAQLMISQGRHPAPTQAFLKLADDLAFSQENLKQDRRRLADRLRKQSARRTAAGTGKPLPKPAGSMTTLERRMADPEIHAKFVELTGG